MAVDHGRCQQRRGERVDWLGEHDGRRKGLRVQVENGELPELLNGSVRDVTILFLVSEQSQHICSHSCPPAIVSDPGLQYSGSASDQTMTRVLDLGVSI